MKLASVSMYTRLATTSTSSVKSGSGHIVAKYVYDEPSDPESASIWKQPVYTMKHIDGEVGRSQTLLSTEYVVMVICAAQSSYCRSFDGFGIWVRWACLGGVDTEAPTSQPDRTHPSDCDGPQQGSMAADRLYQHINISGNARVLLGDNVNGDKRVGGSASRAEALLEWLHYPRMTSRKESVRDTHADTFQWILGFGDLGDKPNPGFRTWLEGGSGIYWVAGKAGSGKSTLMKLITGHRETQEALAIWAGDKVLICPSFYFWYGGTQIQRSQLGMLRSLLHELLLTNKALIPVAFPLWTEKDGVEEPDFPEVAAAFRKTLDADERKICFFIDGLDEYEGDSIRTAELADYLGDLAKSSTSVKLVVSSRPLNELQIYIRAWPHLMLQDLTSGDILNFVEDKLRRNGQMLRLEK